VLPNRILLFVVVKVKSMYVSFNLRPAPNVLSKCLEEKVISLRHPLLEIICIA